MMGNKWVQASLLGGFACGIWLGGWLGGFYPMAFIFVGPIVGLASMYVTASARGTDGWGGPYRGKQ